MTFVVYGISNCDQVRKTRAWMTSNGLPHRFHDFRRDGLERSQLERWCSHVPWSALLNKRGLTWRTLPEEERRRIVDQSSAIELMLSHPTLIKRPVVEIDADLLLGFSVDRLREASQRHGLLSTERPTIAAPRAGS